MPSVSLMYSVFVGGVLALTLLWHRKLYHERLLACWSPPLRRYGRPRGPHWMFLGTVHGNEPAGGVALWTLLRYLDSARCTVSQGSLTVLPVGTPCGLRAGTRWSPIEADENKDLNRIYRGERPSGFFGTFLWQQGDLAHVQGIVDLHEGWEYHARTPASIGTSVQGLGAHGEAWAPALVDLLNDRRSHTMAAPFVWISKEERYDIPGSLYAWCARQGRDYLLIETTGRPRGPPLPVRAAQHLSVVWEVGRRVGLWQEAIPDQEELERECAITARAFSAWLGRRLE